MNKKKAMVSEKTNSSGIGDVRYDIKEGRIRARATVTLCNDTRKRLQGQGNNKRDALQTIDGKGIPKYEMKHWPMRFLT